MAIYKSVSQAVTSVENGIDSSKSKVLALVATQFTRDANDRYVPFLHGQLRGSALLTPKNKLSEGIVIWNTPYAVRRYFENHLHPDKTKWDIKTWDKNVKTYEKLGAVSYDTELKRYMK